jgi:hypothetical protein
MIGRLMRKDLLRNWTMAALVAAGIATFVAILDLGVGSARDGGPPVAVVLFVAAWCSSLLPAALAGRDERYRTRTFDLGLPVTYGQVVLPLILSLGFRGLVFVLVAIQVLLLGVLIVGPRIGLRGGILAVEDAIRSIGPGLRGLRAMMGDLTYFLALFAALAALFTLSYLVSCALYGRRDL